MRFTLSSTTLSSRLSTLSKVITNKNAIAILESFLFEVRDGQLTITASDSENVMKSTCALDETDGNGSFAVSSQTILDAVRELPEQPLTFDVDTDQLVVKVYYQNGMYNFTVQNAEEYPQTQPMPTDVTRITFASGVLLANISRTLFATASEELRPVMNGIYFDITPEYTAIVASDGRKLVRSLITCDTNNVTASFILPQKPVNIIRAVVDKALADIKISTYAEGNATFDMGDYVMHCRLITEAYPNYKKVIPQNNDRIATLDREGIIGALRRVMVGADHATCLVKMQFEADKLTLTAENNNYAQSAEEHIICQYEGMPIKIGFQGNFLMDLLGRLNTEEVIIQLSDPSRAGLILPSKQEEKFNILMLLMPLLITN